MNWNNIEGCAYDLQTKGFDGHGMSGRLVVKLEIFLVGSWSGN